MKQQEKRSKAKQVGCTGEAMVEDALVLLQHQLSHSIVLVLHQRVQLAAEHKAEAGDVSNISDQRDARATGGVL